MGVGCRVTTLVLAGTDLGLASCWLLSSPSRSSSPSYVELKRVVPMRGWGAVFAVAGALLLLSLHRRVRHPAAYAGLALNVGLLILWALLFGFAALADGRVGYDRAVGYGALAVVHIMAGARLLAPVPAPDG